MQKVLAIFAHPDDEAFGPGGTIALWTAQSIEVHLLCATKGEAGTPDEDQVTAQTRSQELIDSAQILGIKTVEFLDLIDGEIGNKQMVKLEKIISNKITELQPNILLTFHLNGVSGHLDHIAVASAVTKSFQNTQIAEKLYYYAETKETSDQMDDYFVYFPEGIDPSEADEAIDITSVYDTRIKAMHCHQS